MLLIGLSGKLGVGKNYVAEQVLPRVLEQVWEHRFGSNVPQIFQLAFGDQMKVELAARSPEMTYDSLFQNKTRETRQLMQLYGTDLCRKQFGPDVWVRSMDTWIQIHKNRLGDRATPVFVISDVRFKNEADWIQKRGGLLIRVVAMDRNMERLAKENSIIDAQASADGTTQHPATHIAEHPAAHTAKHTAQHRSETELDDYPFEYMVTNHKDTTLQNLQEQVRKVLIHFLHLRL